MTAASSGTRYPTPRHGPPPGAAEPSRSFFARRLRRWHAAIRAALGLRRRFAVEGVIYRETGAQPLSRALSRKGPGFKDYRVKFPDGSDALIRCTPKRVYADLQGPFLLPRYRHAEHLIRPGMRALDIACGTGYAAAWLARAVGPSGAVVAIDPDEESIAYAQRRYPTGNIAFETGTLDALFGETDGAFDAVLTVSTLHGAPDPAAFLAELWRVVAPGGWLFVSTPARPTGAERPASGATTPLFDHAGLEALLTAACRLTDRNAPKPEFLSSVGDDTQEALIHKPPE